MKNTIRIAIVIIAFIIINGCSVDKNVAHATTIDLDKVVSEVKMQYDEAASELATKNNIHVDITSADLALKVTETISGTAGITILIFKPSVKVSDKRATTVNFHFEKPTPSSLKDRNLLPKSKSLKDIIEDVAIKYSSINTSIGTLVKKNFEIDIAFSIEYDASLGISFNVWGVGGNFSPEYDKAVEHDLKLVFTLK